MIRRRQRGGTVAVEFAVVASVLLMLTFTAIDLGLLYLTQQALNDGVSQAVRWAAVNSTSDSAANIASRFSAAVTPVLGAAQSAKGRVTVGFSPSAAPGGTVTVQASLAWRPFTRFDFLPSVTLSSTQSLVIQH